MRAYLSRLSILRAPKEALRCKKSGSARDGIGLKFETWTTSAGWSRAPMNYCCKRVQQWANLNHELRWNKAPISDKNYYCNGATRGAIWSVTLCCKSALDRRGVTWNMIYCCKGGLHSAPGSNLKHRVLFWEFNLSYFGLFFCKFSLQFKASSYFAKSYRAAVDVLDRIAPVLKAVTSDHREFKSKDGKNFKTHFSG